MVSKLFGAKESMLLNASSNMTFAGKMGGIFYHLSCKYLSFSQYCILVQKQKPTRLLHNLKENYLEKFIFPILLTNHKLGFKKYPFDLNFHIMSATDNIFRNEAYFNFSSLFS